MVLAIKMSCTGSMTGTNTFAVRDRQPTVGRLDDAMVAVQSDWNGWRTAMVRFGDLQNVHWRQPPGAPRPLIHAIVSCDRFQPGELDHQCGLTGPPHRLLVCILKSHTALPIFEQLSARADSADTASLGRTPRAPLRRRV